MFHDTGRILNGFWSKNVMIKGVLESVQKPTVSTAADNANGVDKAVEAEIKDGGGHGDDRETPHDENENRVSLAKRGETTSPEEDKPSLEVVVEISYG